ncbi:MAG: glycoside hydrolase family 97 protein [Deltaproteobacteria bacterium]|nr:MAG: glycoside hydrolase family 97 protein [Deltaproteobacteria bacterium]
MKVIPFALALLVVTMTLGLGCSDYLGSVPSETPIQKEASSTVEAANEPPQERDSSVGPEPSLQEPGKEPLPEEPSAVKEEEPEPPPQETPTAPNNVVLSPDKSLQFELRSEGGQLSYRIQKGTRTLFDWSRLGLALDGQAPLSANLSIKNLTITNQDNTWKPKWGQHATIRDNHTQGIFELQETTGQQRTLEIVVRMFNDGVAFRYRIPGSKPGEPLSITEEFTQFRVAEQGTAWSIPLSFDTHEKLYSKGAISSVQNANTPITFRLNDGLHLAIHEADLERYAGFSLQRKGDALTVTLPPADKANTAIKVTGVTPLETPWRVILMTDSAGGLVESTTILNLNDPCAICGANTDWIQPRKYVGIWWEIHKGISLWNDGPNVGATTQNAKRYIDFASRAGIPGFLAEGWNVGWSGGKMEFLKANSRFNLQDVLQYARSKQPPVRFIAHMETNADVDNLEQQIDKAFAYYQSLGIDTIKTGYVGDIPKRYHASQGMVQHYQDVLKKAASYKIMVNVHEPIKPTGMRRKYPNLMSGEGARGMEYNAWSAGNPPSHTLTLPFTRILGGPLDYTPGIFYLQWSPQRLPDSPFRNTPMGRVHTTRARQLALYVLLFSGVQMVTDLPEHYNAGPNQGLAPEFAFIREVPATWDETKVLTAEIGEYAVIARRSGQRWFLGAGTDTSPRTLRVPLRFLGNGNFVAQIFADGPGADVTSNPEPVSIKEQDVKSTDTLTITMVGSGGQAIIIRPK